MQQSKSYFIDRTFGTEIVAIYRRLLNSINRRAITRYEYFTRDTNVSIDEWISINIPISKREARVLAANIIYI